VVPFIATVDVIATVDAQATAASTDGGAGAANAIGLPARIAAKLAQAGHDAFREGSTTAARTTLILPLAVLVIGAIACLLMSRQAKRTATTAPPALVTEPV
jgi:hypothetical protein